MRPIVVFAFASLFAVSAFAATLEVEVNREGFTGPLQVAVTPRVDGQRPEWSVMRPLPSDKSSIRFDGLAPGLYVVMVSGPQPLQRLTAKTNLGTNGTSLHLDIPRLKTELLATLEGKPLPHAEIAFTHEKLRWNMQVETGEDGRFIGELWEPGTYTASVRRDHHSAPHTVNVSLSSQPLSIDVPDRHVRGRILDGGKPLAGATIDLRSETSESILTVRTFSGPDGRFEFFGVREGALALTARAPSYLDSDAIAFELRGSPAQRSIDVEMMRGNPRAVRVVDARDVAIAGATLIASCNGNVKSTSVTNADGRADVPLPTGDTSCAVYVLPKEGSIAIERVQSSKPLLIHVREATSSLRLALQSDAGQVFSAMSLLMRIDGNIVPPAIARLIHGRGFPLVTNEEGFISMQRIPTGTYEFWPYRNSAEGQQLYETATEFDAPISVKVVTGENDATVRFKAR